ncbi:MAG: PadR family transcriptional regulator [Chloroflexi bacterium HGW-Chloroflexi-6]|nr:MAG: PadR family transcriptional regulator [Chloroflexi bacterium HGW-Chloroflexi-6]
MAEQIAPQQPLTPAVFHILLALADGEKHGYLIMKDVEAQTGGRLKMGPGTLYGSIKRMLTAGFIEEAEERPDPSLDDERRRYYRLSNMGQKVLSTESQRLEQAVKIARQKQVLACLTTGA